MSCFDIFAKKFQLLLRWNFDVSYISCKTMIRYDRVDRKKCNYPFRTLMTDTSQQLKVNNQVQAYLFLIMFDFSIFASPVNQSLSNRDQRRI